MAKKTDDQGKRRKAIMTALDALMKALGSDALEKALNSTWAEQRMNPGDLAVLQNPTYAGALGNQILTLTQKYAAEVNWNKRRHRNGRQAKSYGGEVGPAGLFLAPRRRRALPLPVNAGRVAWFDGMNHLFWRERGALRPLNVSRDNGPRIFKVYGPKDLRGSDRPQSPANSFFENLLTEVWPQWSYSRPATLAEAWALANANPWLLEYGCLLVGATFCAHPRMLYVPVIRRSTSGKLEVYAATVSELVGGRIIYKQEMVNAPAEPWMIPFIQDDWHAGLSRFSLESKSTPYTSAVQLQRVLQAQDREKITELPWQHEPMVVRDQGICLLRIPGYRGIEEMMAQEGGYIPLSMEEARDWLPAVIEYVTELEYRYSPDRDKYWTRDVVFTGSTVPVERRLHIPVLTVSGDGMHRIGARPYEWRFDGAYFLTAGRQKPSKD